MEKYKNEIDEKRFELKELNKKGNVTIATKMFLSSRATTPKIAHQPILPSITEGQAQMLAQQMINTQLEIFRLEADIKAMEDEARRMSEDDEQHQSYTRRTVGTTDQG